MIARAKSSTTEAVEPSLRVRPGLVVVCAAAVVAAHACGGSPTSPGPQPQPTPNTPPVIESIAVEPTRVEVDGQVTVVATVRDAETPVSQLTYEWTASAGTFTGQGPSVSWRPPADAATPADFVMRLTVREQYGTAPPGGQRPEHRVMADSNAIRVHNSPRELGDMAIRFLSDFANSSVSPDTCVREFSDTCRGKEQERSDIEDNRRNYEILSSSLRLREVTVAGDGLTGGMRVNCAFTSRVKQCPGTSNCSIGGTESVAGDCLLTAVYQQSRWWLCTSRFSGEDLAASLAFFGSSR